MKEAVSIISPEQFDAVIFDMDGVVTRTADLHATAWKEMFDHFLAGYAGSASSTAPFDIDRDYSHYVDGKPRYDGVRDFLASRGITLPEGSPGDPPTRQTVCGLGNRKNDYFQDVLGEKGAERYESTVALIERLHRAGLKTAIISASKNARQVLKASQTDTLFDARIDGINAEQLQIPGKPAPDVFLAAAQKLGVAAHRAVVVEDARAGVQAGRAGRFGLVIGVNRANQRDALAEYADWVVEDLSEIGVTGSRDQQSSDELTSALDHFEEILARVKNRQPVVFLDYDGTLTPIVACPEQARLSDRMRQAIRQLADCCPVAVVSGRDGRDIRQRVGLEDVHYAGCHGFEIFTPDGRTIEHPQGQDYLPALARAEQALREQLEPVDRVQVERKRFAIAVHYRRVAEDKYGAVEAAVDTVRDRIGSLRKTGGKKIFELRPDLDWDKGRALGWLLKQGELARDRVVPIYLGDDLTDEDAFREIDANGISILVRDEVRPTRARYALEDTAQVGIFLDKLAKALSPVDS